MDSLREPSDQFPVFSENFAHMTVQARGVSARNHPLMQIEYVGGEGEFQPGSF